ncbi:MAG: pseudouridine synthase [Flaviflexus sp.]|nr:pseudouridine synthase [Flaviflexus sp.]
MPPASPSDYRRAGLDPVRLDLVPADSLAQGITLALAAKGAADAGLVDEALARGDVINPDTGPLQPGDPWVARVWIHRPIPDECHWPLTVLDRGPGWVAIDKPAGLACTPQGSFVARSVLVQARRQIGDLSPVHRLDRATSGVLLLAEPMARAELGRCFARGQVEKIYELIAPLGEEKMEVSAPAGEPGRERPARTRFSLLDARGGYGRYEARPEGGRFHQIRQHAAKAGIPIVGDGRYGRGPAAPDRIELLARELRLIRAKCGEEIRLTSQQRLSLPL